MHHHAQILLMPHRNKRIEHSSQVLAPRGRLGACVRMQDILQALILQELKMNISPVSFGKIIRVNGSMEAAQKAVDLINNPAKNKDEKENQDQLRKIFNDRACFATQVISANGKPYILSGIDSEEAEYLRRDTIAEIERVAQECGDGDMLDIEIEVQGDYYQAQLETMVKKHSDARDLHLGFNKNTKEITSIDFRA